MRRKIIPFLYLKSSDGTAAVEFSFIAPVLIFLMLGLIDFGFYINAFMQMESAARAGAEYVLKGGDSDSIQEDIIDQTAFSLSSENINSITVESALTCECRNGDEISCDTGTCGEDDFRRNFITVQVSMPYDALFPYPGLPENITVKGRTRLQIE